jgi:uncharacterized protein
MQLDPQREDARAQALRATVQARREEILALAAHYGASNVRLFGSLARGAAHAQSDVDLLVTLADDRSLLDLVGLWQDLEALLGHSVDVVTDRSLHERIRERVLQEAVAL